MRKLKKKSSIMGFTFEMETNSKYSAILELDRRMTKLNIPHVLRRCYDGWEILYPTIADVIMDAVSHILVNDSKDLIEVMGPDRYMDETCTGITYEGLTAAQAIEHFYVHYRIHRTKVNRLLPPKPIKASRDFVPEFYDIESREYVTREQLYKEYDYARTHDPNDEQGYRDLTFGEYIRNCLTQNNGTLIYV